VGGDGRIEGNDGNDSIFGFNDLGGAEYLYGDTSETAAATDFYGPDFTASTGDDMIYGGEDVTGDVVIAGGGGNDIIIGGNGAAALYTIYGDHIMPDANGDFLTSSSPVDGDDLIRIGDNPASTGEALAFGQGGNDKIIGGIGQINRIYGGDGDDQLLANNQDQTETTDGQNYIEGNDGNDWIFGSNKMDRLYGDGSRQTSGDSAVTMDDLTGGDDVIYTGESAAATDGDIVHGGFGDDYIYGEGIGEDRMYGEWGNDLIDGGAGDDYIWGDDYRAADFATMMNTGLMVGHDTLYGGDGVDHVYGGHGDDYIFGGIGDDYLYGHSGEDSIWGEDGDDIIYTGSGWDTVFGGEGCDTIYSEDGGDVIWLGGCEAPGMQTLTVTGTGTDPENYTVIMDFWETD